MKKAIKDKLYFHVLLEQDYETKEFVALCLDLDIASEGATMKEALNNLKEAVDLYIECAIEDKDFGALFRPAPKQEWEKFYARKALSCNNTLLDLDLVSA